MPPPQEQITASNRGKLKKVSHRDKDRRCCEGGKTSKPKTRMAQSPEWWTNRLALVLDVVVTVTASV